MKTLEELTIKYDVDALELGYTPHYAKLFDTVREDVTKVLEIGVETGRSHWKKDGQLSILLLTKYFIIIR